MKIARIAIVTILLVLLAWLAYSFPVKVYGQTLPAAPIDNLQPAVDAVKVQVTKLQSDNATLTKKLSTAIDATAQVSTQLTAMAQQLTAANSTIADLTAKLAAAKPYTLKWDDRHGIGMLMRGPLGPNPTITALVGHYKWSTDNVVAKGGQAWIAWDAGTNAYDGDPRLSGIDLAVWDQIFAYAKSNGLKTGFTLRADKIGTQYGQKGDDAIAAQIIETVKFAYARWGCTVFYVDSNDIFNFTLQPRVNAALAGMLLIWENAGGTETDNAGVLPIEAKNYVPADARWAKAIQDALRTGSLLVSFQSNRTWYGVPPWAPGFRVLRMDRWLNETVDTRTKYQNALGAELRAGGIVMWECWFNNGETDEFKRLVNLP